MEEKGGESSQNNEKAVSKNYVDSKIAMTTILVVVFGAVFVLGLVLIGIQVSNRCTNNTDEQSGQTAVGPIMESIEVDYDSVYVDYNAPSSDSEEATNSFLALNGVKDEEYAIIHSSSELDDFVDAINSVKADDGAPFVYSVGSDFFKTGSIIAVAKEAAGFNVMDIEKVTRDESYNIHIDGSYSRFRGNSSVSGGVTLIQIQNIQPKTVTISWDASEHDNTADIPVKKPIVYLYPTKTTKVNVMLSNPERLTTDYPDYQKGWTVTAQPNGTLTDQNGKKYYALYYESKNTKKYSSDSLKEGFVVSREKVESFLDEKLAVLGLNFKEREEFITYWAGILEEKPYTFIRFQTAAEIEKNMGLIVAPKPDTMIRIVMEYQNLDTKIETKPQQLLPVSRQGFTVVEWGGTEIK